MSNINIRRAVENIRFGTTVYTPVVELIVNAIQAIRAVSKTGGLIDVTVLRSSEVDLLDRLSPIEGFIVKDDGIGFNLENRDSFDTLYTELKAPDGGKGFGRFTCLKYFDHFTVKSVFSDGPNLKQRTFALGTGKDIITGEEVSDTDQAQTGSEVTISGIKGVKFPEKGIDVVSRILVEKLLPYFINPNSECPRIIIRDGITGTPSVLNDYLSKEERQITELSIDSGDIVLPRQEISENFSVRVFKFYSPKSNKSKISLVAHQREVTDVTIQTYIPEFADEFYEPSHDGDTRDRNFILKAYVFGSYLDDNVSVERGGFVFQKDSDVLLGISQTQIEEAAAAIASKSVGQEITARQTHKQERIHEYIEREAPWHRNLSREADFSSLPMRPSPQEIEMHLQKEKIQREIKTRAAVAQVLASNNRAELADRVVELVGSISQASQNDLIHYVSMRKCVLDLFEKALEVDENGVYSSEGEVHDIIMPRKKDSIELNYDQHNLWILDERLNFADYITSDKNIDGAGSDRTDITIFNRRIAFRGDNEPSNPITIFEFKRPQRHDFANQSSDEDPVDQIIRYVNEIRDGKYRTPKGRDILVTENTPFYGYVVCDLPKKIKDWLERTKNFTPMPDGLGYFQWFGNIKLYIEVLGWEKVLRDAGMRNKVFFKQLGI
jgi:hypothetical protein